MDPARAGHPLQRCLNVVEDLLSMQEAQPFASPVCDPYLPHVNCACPFMPCPSRVLHKTRKPETCTDKAFDFVSSFQISVQQLACSCLYRFWHAHKDSAGLQVDRATVGDGYFDVVETPMDLGTIRSAREPQHLLMLCVLRT